MDVDFSYLQDVMDAAVRATHAHRGLVHALADGARKSFVAAQTGLSPAMVARFPAIDFTDSSTAVGRAIFTRQQALLPDIETDAAYALHRPAARLTGSRAVIATPLISRKGGVLGVLVLLYNGPQQFSALMLREAAAHARMAAMVIEAGRLKAEIRNRFGAEVPQSVTDVDLKAAIRRLRPHAGHTPPAERILSLGDQYVTQMLGTLERFSRRRPGSA